MTALKFPKPPSRLAEKQKRRAYESRQMRECFGLVDKREMYRCRVCKRAVNPTTTSQLDRGHHHHVVYRSLGGEHKTEDVCLLCAFCHHAVHNATMRLTGNANKELKLERHTEGGWRVDRWV